MPISTESRFDAYGFAKPCTRSYHVEQCIANDARMTVPILCNLSMHSLDLVGVANLVLPVCRVVTNSLLGNLNWLLVVLALQRGVQLGGEGAAPTHQVLAHGNQRLL